MGNLAFLQLTLLPTSYSLSHTPSPSLSLIHLIDCMRFFVMLQTSAKQLTNSNMPQESVSLVPFAIFSAFAFRLTRPLTLSLFLACIVVRLVQSMSARSRQKVLPTFVRCVESCKLTLNNIILTSFFLCAICMRAIARMYTQ